MTTNMLAKTASRILVKNKEELVELLVDDLMLETVNLLNEIETFKNEKKKFSTKNKYINDFIE